MLHRRSVGELPVGERASSLSRPLAPLAPRVTNELTTVNRVELRNCGQRPINLAFLTSTRPARIATHGGGARRYSSADAVRAPAFADPANSPRHRPLWCRICC